MGHIAESNSPIPIPYAELPARRGDEFLSHWVTIDQDRIDRFADVTDDHNWVHVDIARASALRGTTIAHGLLTLTLAPGLLYSLFEVTGLKHTLNYGLESVRFTDIVPVDSRIRMRVTIGECVTRGPGFVLHMPFTFEREGSEKPVLVGRMLAMQFPA